MGPPSRRRLLPVAGIRMRLCDAEIFSGKGGDPHEGGLIANVLLRPIPTRHARFEI